MRVPQFGFTLKKKEKKVIYLVLPTFDLSFCCELSFRSIWSNVTTFLNTEKKKILPTLYHIVLLYFLKFHSPLGFTKVKFFFKRTKKSVLGGSNISTESLIPISEQKNNWQRCGA